MYLHLVEYMEMSNPCAATLIYCSCTLFISALHSLVATGFCWVSYLAYPNLLGTKGFVVAAVYRHINGLTENKNM